MFSLTCVDGLLAYEVISFQVYCTCTMANGKDIVIQLEYINMSDQTTDILTKHLRKVKVDHFITKLAMVGV